MHSEIRKDYIQDKYVIIAPQRTKRPHDVNYPDEERKTKKHPAQCVFCPGTLKKQKILYTVGPKNNWQIAVVPNKYPAISLDNPKAYGVQEVVVETPNPNEHLDELPVEHIAKLLEVYAERTKVVSKIKKIEYILIFKNDGGKAGASLRHAHSQIFATQFLPPHIFDKCQKVQAYKLEHGTCVYCNVIKKEMRDSRLVYKNDYVIAFCPYASIHNYEIWILPLRHLDNITQLTPQERLSWAKILKHILHKISHELHLPYNFYFHQVIFDEDQHLYMKITPRGSAWAGVEIGSGLIINPIPPEEAAKFYHQRLLTKSSP